MSRFRALWAGSLILGLGLTFLASTGCGEEAGEDTGEVAREGTEEVFQPEETIPGVRSELVVAAHDGVTSIAFAPDGRLFFTEINSGAVRIFTPEGELLPEPFAQVDLPVDRESNMQGIAIDPEFETNHYVYVHFKLAAQDEPNLGRPILMRFTDVDNRGADPTELIEFPLVDPEIPIAPGGRVHFGPDGYLYMTIGDVLNARFEQLAQDLSSPFGKILRVTRDGAPAPDNPFLDEPAADHRIYAYGLRDAGDFAFDQGSGRIYASDRADCDELNIIEAGENYGWPPPLDTAGPPCQRPGDIQPIHHYSAPGKSPGEAGARVAPTGIEFVSGEVYPALGDGLLVCEFKTRFMRRLQLDGPNRDQVTDDSVVVQDCTTALAADPNGVIYYSNGKEIRRLPPQ